MTDRLSDCQSQVGNYYAGQHISLFNHCALFPSHANFTESFKYIVRLKNLWPLSENIIIINIIKNSKTIFKIVDNTGASY
jgi:hypothetical protein